MRASLVPSLSANANSKNDASFFEFAERLGESHAKPSRVGLVDGQGWCEAVASFQLH